MRRKTRCNLNIHRYHQGLSTKCTFVFRFPSVSLISCSLTSLMLKLQISNSVSPHASAPSIKWYGNAEAARTLLKVGVERLINAILLISLFCINISICIYQPLFTLVLFPYTIFFLAKQPRSLRPTKPLRALTPTSLGKPSNIHIHAWIVHSFSPYTPRTIPMMSDGSYPP